MSNTYLKRAGKYQETAEQKLLLSPDKLGLAAGRYIVEVGGKPVETLDTNKPLTVQVAIS